MGSDFLITTSLENNMLLLTLCGPVRSEQTEQVREAIVPLIKLFDEPFSLIIDMREVVGSQLDAIHALRKLWNEYEDSKLARIIRIFPNEHEDFGISITNHFHLKHIPRIHVYSMREALERL